MVDRQRPNNRALPLPVRSARRDLRGWVAAVTVLAALIGASGCTADPPPAAGVIQSFAPDNRATAPELTGELLDGTGRLDPAGYAGSVVVVNFWASWCGPCVAEAPELEATYQALKDRGVVFVGINVRDDLDNARAFAAQHTTYPTILDSSSRLALGFAVQPNAIPATIVIDRQGRIAAVIRSAVAQHELEPLVTSLAAEAL